MIDDRLKELGIALPDAAAPSFNYVPVTVHNGVAYVSGQMPKVDGAVRVFGKVGAEVDNVLAHIGDFFWRMIGFRQD